MTAPVPPLTLLYVPADRPERVAKAFATAADVVLVDLEDAVAPSHKRVAREHTCRLLSDFGRWDKPAQVRINSPETCWYSADLEMVASLPLAVGVRVPKVESADQVRAVARALPERDLHLIIESALGLERAFDIATASDRVASIGLGEADLCSDLGADPSGLVWPRSRLVVAARAAGLPWPAMSVYPNVRDSTGLAASCRAGRSLGFCGRAAIHPRQLAVIRDVFSPSADDVARATETVNQVAGATAAGIGAIALADGTFLDRAMIEHARMVLALAGK